jgi:hypothetical protein
MSFDLSDLEKKIERKISDLEREKGQLKDDLKVVRQASVIASDFDADGGGSDWKSKDSYEESANVG